ncbi:MAG: hypothetical protein H6713_05380 [Myxococcales bacterium]|nr:hypothetical protein [Myxococcales bacterium]MCB9749427.1 hypothetical protein [Myxococcales bacterium]
MLPRARTLRTLSAHLALFTATCAGTIACDAMLGGSGNVNTNVQGVSKDSLVGAVKGAACPELVSGANALQGKFTADAKANATIGAFIQASKDFEAAANQANIELSNTCKKMGADLGVPADQMKPADGPGGASKGACAAVSAKIQSILSGGVQIKVDAQPPRCQVNANAQAQCEGHCGAKLTPAEIVAKCEPGKISGTCQGTCSGRCEGTCNGKCEGQCTAKDAQGNCTGECSGTCTGQCSATCHAKCEGEWQAPRCEGEFKGPKAEVDCRASCKASAEFKAQCTKPSLNIQTSGNAAALAKLSATLKANLPALLAVQFKLAKQMAGDVKTLARLSGELKGELKGAGGKAIACVTGAATAIVSASASVKVSVEASASVSGKVGAKV